jgi:membrane associated rhomboid family serine protease
VVYWLIGINVAVHLMMMLVARGAPETHDQLLSAMWLSYDSTPGVLAELAIGEEAVGGGGEEDAAEMRELRRSIEQEFASEAPLTFKLWSPITYQFLHGGLLHLLGNMLFLWVFGPNLEDRFGRWRFLGFYLVGGVFAGFAHLLFALDRLELPSGDSISIAAPVIGASGSIAACTGAYLCLFPKTRVKVLLFFFLIGVFFIPATWFIAFAIVRDLFLQGLSEVSERGTGTAHMAHLGGYAFGFAAAYVALARGFVQREPYDLFSLHKQVRRRRAYRDLVEKSGTGGWSSETAPDAKVQQQKRRRDPGKTHADAVTEAIAAERAKLAEQAAGGDVEGAARGYVRFVDKRGAQAMSRDAQLAVANELNRLGEHTNAAMAYQQFVEKYPSDPETNRVYVLLALVQSRQLNDPVGASASLERVKPDRLSGQEKTLFEALRREVE